jgi:Putative MetA-pathway of phenol degradation
VPPSYIRLFSRQHAKSHLIRHLPIVTVWVVLAGMPLAAQVSPTAPPQEDAIQPDRPDVTNGTHIVDTGLLQVEIGGLFTRTAPGQHAFGSPFTARVGLLEWLEARIGTDGFLTQSQGDRRVAGVGNLQLGAKLRLWADPGGIPVLSVLPAVNVPTASAEKGLGSGDPDFTLALLTGTDIGAHGHLDLNYGIGSIGAGGGRPHFAQHLASVSASMAASERWNPYAEIFWFSRQDIDGGAMTSTDIGAIYTVSPRLALDGGFQVGLSHAAPGLVAFGGISIVVGNVLGNHGVIARRRQAQRRAASPRK